MISEPGAPRPGGKGRGRGPARPGGGGGEGPQGLHANAEPRPEGGGVAAAAEPGALRSQGRSARFRAEGDSAGRERREPGRARAAGLTALAAAAAPDDVGPGASCLLRRDLRLFMAKSGQSRSRRARRACPAREPQSLGWLRRRRSTQRCRRSRPHLPPGGPRRPPAASLSRAPAPASQSVRGSGGGGVGLDQSEPWKEEGLPFLT